jgi:predicted glycogen debranching enzyme
MLRHLLPALDGVVSAHQAGTRFGIRVAGDGLLTQGESAVALTWMDAKVDDWVVTPRRGKAVELNALWYNAVSLLAQWHHDFDGSTSASSSIAELTKRTFNQRFWFAGGGYLYDIVDGERGDDRSCRPNQLLAFSLRYPVLDKGRWRPVLDVVSERLLTPFGLRTLEPADPGFKSQYFGDLRARDAAYHQGTVWPWLLGPFIDAWLRVNPERRTDARALLAAFDRHLSDACVGSVSEIFDATEPFAPRGCIAQAWSVAEVLRCLVGLGEPFADESPAGGESTSA